MVSSFSIRTSIHVHADRALLDAFNEFEPDMDAIVPGYFDQGFGCCSGGFPEPFDKSELEPLRNFCVGNKWRLKYSDGLLYDKSEKFHGAVSLLHHMIESFFSPRGILLNGTIVGVNTEFTMLYVYNVHDNEISLDAKTTKKYLPIYASILKDYDDDTEHPSDYMLDRVCEKLGVAKPRGFGTGCEQM